MEPRKGIATEGTPQIEEGASQGPMIKGRKKEACRMCGRPLFGKQVGNPSQDDQLEEHHPNFGFRSQRARDVQILSVSISYGKQIAVLQFQHVPRASFFSGIPSSSCGGTSTGGLGSSNGTQNAVIVVVVARNERIGLACPTFYVALLLLDGTAC